MQGEDLPSADAAHGQLALRSRLFCALDKAVLFDAQQRVAAGGAIETAKCKGSRLCDSALLHHVLCAAVPCHVMV
jgi:hypothetical protein